LRRQIVDLLGPNLSKEALQAGKVGQVPVDEFDVVHDPEPTQPRIHRLVQAASANQTVHFVSLAEKKLGEVGTVLAGYTSNESSFHGKSIHRDTQQSSGLLQLRLPSWKGLGKAKLGDGDC
jgi:hypothetical protein